MESEKEKVTAKRKKDERHHLKAGQKVPQVWERIQALGFKYTVKV
jgi:hypothetical protein